MSAIRPITPSAPLALFSHTAAVSLSNLIKLGANGVYPAVALKRRRDKGSSKEKIKESQCDVSRLNIRLVSHLSYFLLFALRSSVFLSMLVALYESANASS